MGRAYARLPLHLWRTSAFVELSMRAQWLYAVLVGQPMSFVGVMPITIERWSHVAADVVPDDVVKALDELRLAGWVFVDDDTQELLVPAFAAHVGSLDTPNLRKASASDFDVVLSRRLRAVIAGLVPERHRAQVIGDAATDVIAVPLLLHDSPEHGGGKGLRDGIEMPFGMGSECHTSGHPDAIREKGKTENGKPVCSSTVGKQAEPILRGCEDDDPRVAAAMWTLAARDLDDARARRVGASEHPDYLRSLAEDRAELLAGQARALCQLHPDADADAIALLLVDDERALHHE